jgi:hypothetical protein
LPWLERQRSASMRRPRSCDRAPIPSAPAPSMPPGARSRRGSSAAGGAPGA